MGPAGWVFLVQLLLGVSGTEEEEPKNLVKSICGRPAVLSGIASGMEANVGQWPWQVSIRQDLLHVCAATLISERWVLTTASCFRPVVLPICLPTSAIQLKNSTSCWTTGWGNSGMSQPMKPSYTLKELKVPLIDLQTCNNYYQKESLLHGVKPISEDMICSRLPVGPTDQCRGSRGDPLTCKVEDFWVLAGVMSGESNCSRTNEPQVYTNISFYKSWIEKSATSHADLSATPSPDFSGLFPLRLLPLIFLRLP
ncbi:polyserase-2-like isoform X3 [Phacochoerus africanus]|uniref:polyserase-2-like isoform X3 n=1 Tax=Phacochoerus africanus TaxID=41426 RepID=UPI001FD916FE|nr:polyserase-2-like isoform X3 [Phacochoerus africanus]